MILYCASCNKPVSTPVPDSTVFGAVITCLECFKKEGSRADKLDALCREMLAEMPMHTTAAIGVAQLDDWEKRRKEA